MVESVVGAAAWVVVGCVFLYAKSRGWTADWEQAHPGASTVALVFVLWAAAGSFVLLLVLAVAVATPLELQALAVIAPALAAAILGHLDSLAVARRVPEGRSLLPKFATGALALVVLQLLLKGTSAFPWAAAQGAIAFIAFVFGTRWRPRPLPTAGS